MNFRFRSILFVEILVGFGSSLKVKLKEHHFFGLYFYFWNFVLMSIYFNFSFFNFSGKYALKIPHIPQNL